jgi:N-acetylmuramoyl-L-alanine amidase
MKICIDAGHGGNDPGVINGIKEKDINLNCALRLERLLASINIETILTRNDDTFLNLKDRCIIANEANADLFISLHCNSYVNNEPHGVQVLYYKSGKKIAEMMQAEFEKIYPYESKWNHTVYRDNLTVLKYTNMPAVLIEMAYLNNEEDKRLLMGGWYTKYLMVKLKDLIMEWSK